MENRLTVIGRREDIGELADLLRDAGVEGIPKAIPQRGLAFGGGIAEGLVIVLGSGGVASALAACIMAYLRDRKKALHIAIGPDQFTIDAENYTVEDLKALLAQVQLEAFASIQMKRR
jgi:asparagine synthetase B (glutamine-hydrolysing)